MIAAPIQTALAPPSGQARAPQQTGGGKDFTEAWLAQRTNDEMQATSTPEDPLTERDTAAELATGLPEEALPTVTTTALAAPECAELSAAAQVVGALPARQPPIPTDQSLTASEADPDLAGAGQGQGPAPAAAGDQLQSSDRMPPDAAAAALETDRQTIAMASGLSLPHLQSHRKGSLPPTPPRPMPGHLPNPDSATPTAHPGGMPEADTLRWLDIPARQMTQGTAMAASSGVAPSPDPTLAVRELSAVAGTVSITSASGPAAPETGPVLPHWSTPGPANAELRATVNSPAPAAPPSVQIAEALVQTRNGQVDVILHPEELGRIRLILIPDGDSTRVQLTAERPETLDLLRRHSHELAVELRQAGMSGASFSFAGDDATGQRPGADRPGEHSDGASPATETDVIQRSRVAGAGLDLRL